MPKSRGKKSKVASGSSGTKARKPQIEAILKDINTPQNTPEKTPELEEETKNIKMDDAYGVYNEGLELFNDKYFNENEIGKLFKEFVGAKNLNLKSMLEGVKKVKNIKIDVNEFIKNLKDEYSQPRRAQTARSEGRVVRPDVRRLTQTVGGKNLYGGMEYGNYEPTSLSIAGYQASEFIRANPHFLYGAAYRFLLTNNYYQTSQYYVDQANMDQYATTASRLAYENGLNPELTRLAFYMHLQVRTLIANLFSFGFILYFVLGFYRRGVGIMGDASTQLFNLLSGFGRIVFSITQYTFTADEQESSDISQTGPASASYGLFYRMIFMFIPTTITQAVLAYILSSAARPIRDAISPPVWSPEGIQMGRQAPDGTALNVLVVVLEIIVNTRDTTTTILRLPFRGIVMGVTALLDQRGQETPQPAQPGPQFSQGLLRDIPLMQPFGMQRSISPRSARMQMPLLAQRDGRAERDVYRWDIYGGQYDDMRPRIARGRFRVAVNNVITGRNLVAALRAEVDQGRYEQAQATTASDLFASGFDTFNRGQGRKGKGKKSKRKKGKSKKGKGKKGKGKKGGTRKIRR